jgi:hypothetical protein
MPNNVPVGYEYANAASYPHDGLFLQGVNLYSHIGMVVFSCGTIDTRTLIDIPEPFAEATLQAAGGISEMTLLKALAIAQNPNLAEKLCL